MDLLDEPLAEIVGGMSFAGEHELDWLVGRQQEVAQTIGLRQEKRGALVGGEPSREADREHLRVEHALTPLHVAHARPLGETRHLQPLANEAHHPLAALFLGSPQLVGDDVFGAGPVARAGPVPLR